MALAIGGQSLSLPPPRQPTGARARSPNPVRTTPSVGTRHDRKYATATGSHGLSGTWQAGTQEQLFVKPSATLPAIGSKHDNNNRRIGSSAPRHQQMQSSQLLAPGSHCQYTIETHKREDATTKHDGLRGNNHFRGQDAPARGLDPLHGHEGPVIGAGPWGTQSVPVKLPGAPGTETNQESHLKPSLQSHQQSAGTNAAGKEEFSSSIHAGQHLIGKTAKDKTEASTTKEGVCRLGSLDATLSKLELDRQRSTRLVNRLRTAAHVIGAFMMGTHESNKSDHESNAQTSTMEEHCNTTNSVPWPADLQQAGLTDVQSKLGREADGTQSTWDALLPDPNRNASQHLTGRFSNPRHAEYKVFSVGSSHLGTAENNQDTAASDLHGSQGVSDAVTNLDTGGTKVAAAEAELQKRDGGTRSWNIDIAALQSAREEGAGDANPSGDRNDSQHLQTTRGSSRHGKRSHSKNVTSNKGSRPSSAHEEDVEDPDEEQVQNFLFGLFEVYAMTTDNKGNPLMNNMSVREFFKDFATGHINKVIAMADVNYNIEIERQRDLHLRYNLTRSEANRGLCFRSFCVLLGAVLPSSKAVASKRFKQYSGNPRAMKADRSSGR